MKNLLHLFCLFFLTTAALAVRADQHIETKCKSADGRLERMEDRVWGRQIILWILDGKAIASGSTSITFLPHTKIQISGDDNVGEYLIYVQLVSPEGEVLMKNVLCKRELVNDDDN